MNTVYSDRRERLRSMIQEMGVDGYLVLHPANRYYLSGFELHDPQCNESAGCLVLGHRSRDLLCTDPRYLDAAGRVWPEEDVFLYRQDKLETLLQFFQKSGISTLGFESGSMSYQTYEVLSKGLEMVPSKGLTEELRKIKHPEEIARLQESCDLNHAIFAELPSLVQTGISESALSWSLETRFRERGASELAFDCIVAFGPNAALPHSIPGQAVLAEQQPVLVDMGGRLQAYCSDQTRTLWHGPKPSDFFQRTLERVQKAQTLAIQAIRPGLELRELYGVAHEYFREQGVEQYFTHGLGHGIGLETHEFPGIGPKSVGSLEPGMVITIEPGLYYPEWGGVRWEHMVLVTDDGARVL